MAILLMVDNLIIKQTNKQSNKLINKLTIDGRYWQLMLLQLGQSRLALSAVGHLSLAHELCAQG
jgi:hypothetical protein